ncbi:hypothetical protein SteCoe_18123 [Stentor coeruleus]|uniref:Uncharacterized protein n=1 Tax=Stentor coeruleus TaxID=5963 RepID=A0A1R2BX59_9CILI|nr:hypothetical protein SteCoe_18123 [Stentor coeruleus]
MSFLNTSSPSFHMSKKRLIPKTINSFSYQNLDKLPKLINFSTSPSLNNSMLIKIKSRHKHEELQVDPVTAAIVVKNYLLPMFEKTKIHESNLSRQHVLGLTNADINPSRDTTAESTIYKELKLSEKLLKELENTNKKIIVAEEKQAVSEQEKHELQAEIDYLKSLNQNILINYEACKLQIHHYNKNFHSSEMKYYFIHKQFEHYKKLNQESEEKIHEISEELHAERNINDIRL